MSWSLSLSAPPPVLPFNAADESCYEDEEAPGRRKDVDGGGGGGATSWNIYMKCYTTTLTGVRQERLEKCQISIYKYDAVKLAVSWITSLEQPALWKLVVAGLT